MAPASGNVATANTMLCCIMAAAKTVNVANRPTPAAKPSRPSTRLKAFMQASSQRIVSGMFHQASVGAPAIDRMRTPPTTHAKPAAASCPESLIHGAQVEQVVQQSDAECQCRARQQPPDQRELLGERAAFFRAHQYIGHQIGNGNGQATHPRDGIAMHLARAIRLVHHPVGPENIPANRGQHQGDDKCSES